MTVCSKPTCSEFLIINDLVRTRDKHICQLCHRKLLKTKRTPPVHHIHYDPDKCFTDLITLCESCHKHTNYNREDYERQCMEILEIRGLLEWKNELKIKMVDATFELNHPVKPWYEQQTKCGKCTYNI